MRSNKSLNKARDAKNDEFYTQLTDVSNEMTHYKKHFKNKVVYCNCDDPTWSAFWKYFHQNFKDLGLKKLISTHYDKNEPTYKMIYEGGDDNNIEAGVKTTLEGNGDFRNKECLDLLDESDIVVTNPPFRLFKEIVTVVMEHKKKFVIIGNINSVVYKEIFALLKENKLWLGANEKGGTRKGSTLCFTVPDGYIGKTENIDGTPMARVPAWWYTNLDFEKRYKKVILYKNYKPDENLILYKTYNPDEYPKYDNYDAINVDKVSEIPCDYDGIMGVPITFFDICNPSQFEIIGLLRPTINGKNKYTRLLIRKKAGFIIIK